MTSPTVTAVGSRRLLDPVSYEDAPHRRGLNELLAEVHSSGLTGRGGAGFPTSRKVRAVAAGARRPVVVGNAMETEPLGGKDAVLLSRNPELVLEGLEALARPLRARRAILATGPDVDARPALAAARGRRVEVVTLDGAFVAGQESALVAQLDGRPALPRDPFVRVSEIGVGGRPTLVLNAETLAQLALVLRHGAEWFRSVGLADDPGTTLVTISGAVARPGVVEVARGRRLGDILSVAQPQRPAAVLVGGYHGAWVPATDLDVRLTNRDLAAYGATVGAGILHVLDEASCPLVFAAEVAEYLAGESAQQCGPCLNGLPHLAATLRQVAQGVRDRSLPAEVRRMAGLVTGRGACAHPDGTARFVGSTLQVFSDHVAAHLDGWCPSASRRAAS